jgi:hypothetical protein
MRWNSVIQPNHCRTCLRAALTLILAGFGTAALADDLITTIEAKPLGELWLNPGMYSHHFNRQKGLNNNNGGFGAEYRFSTVASVAAGRFHNSDRDYSNYASLYYQPFAIGPVRVGAMVVALDGYPRMHDGGWFLAALPIIGYEYGRVGLNVTIVPSYKDRLYGAISFQLKFKIFD